MAVIQSGSGATLMDVDVTPKAGRVILYDALGNVLTPAGNAAVNLAAAGAMIGGRDYKLFRTARVDSFGTLRNSNESLILYDNYTNAAFVDANKWIQTVAGAGTAAVSTTTGLTLNASAITTSGVGVAHLSHRMIPKIAGSPLKYLGRWRLNHVNNAICEFGFGNTTGVTVNVANGAFFRRDASGLLGVMTQNSNELTVAMVAPNTTDYYYYEIFVEDDRVTFVVRTQAGVLYDQQVIQISTTQTQVWSPVSHLQAFNRWYNNTAPLSAPQYFCTSAAVYLCDAMEQRGINIIQSGMGMNSLANPVPQSANMTQLAVYANGANPGAATLTNTTAAGGTGLGGLVNANAMAGGLTDLIMWGWQNPTPYTFYFEGIQIGPPQNLVAALATTDTIFTYGMAFNSSAVSLATAAPYTPMRKSMAGFHRGPVALGIGQFFSGNPIEWRPTTPIAVQPGRFLHLFCRAVLGTATATETFLWQTNVDGWFE